ncbi:EEF1A lysine methyltransferase 1 [Kappamyces sp. JEL0829]|nr:EEF1A lysine methyltransferase 1 [Kappamyces sp. JEL0829]
MKAATNHSGNESDDDLALSQATLALLAQFQQNKRAEEERFEELQKKAHERMLDSHHGRSGAVPLDLRALGITMAYFQEDWQLSQFWYHPDTAQTMALEILSETAPDARIACIASPTAFVALASLDVQDRMCYVLEFDKRYSQSAHRSFSVFGHHFIHYDYNAPTAGLDSLRGSLDYLVLDPPFLSQECWEKTSQTARFLLKPQGKMMVCTGMVMRDQIKRELDCRVTRFSPAHANGLSNEFACYLSYPSQNATFEWMPEAPAVDASK